MAPIVTNGHGCYLRPQLIFVRALRLLQKCYIVLFMLLNSPQMTHYFIIVTACACCFCNGYKPEDVPSLSASSSSDQGSCSSNSRYGFMCHHLWSLFYMNFSNI